MTWAADLTDALLRMVMRCGDDRGHDGFGVKLRGQAWAIARALVAKDFG